MLDLGVLAACEGSCALQDKKKLTQVGVVRLAGVPDGVVDDIAGENSEGGIGHNRVDSVIHASL